MKSIVVEVVNPLTDMAVTNTHNTEYTSGVEHTFHSLNFVFMLNSN